MSISLSACQRLDTGAVEVKYLVEHHGERTCVDAEMRLLIYPNNTQGQIVVNPGQAPTPEAYLDRLAEHCERLAAALRERTPNTVSIPLFK